MVRSIESKDRLEWLRLRSALWPGSHDSVHLSDIDAFFEGRPPIAAVLVSPAPDNQLRGFIELSVRSCAEGCVGPAPYIEGWYVDADVRGQGIGRNLVHAAENWAREHGYTELASDTELHNRASQLAHQALGFTEVERAVHFRKPL